MALARLGRVEKVGILGHLGELRPQFFDQHIEARVVQFAATGESQIRRNLSPPIDPVEVQMLLFDAPGLSHARSIQA